MRYGFRDKITRTVFGQKEILYANRDRVRMDAIRNEMLLFYNTLVVWTVIVVTVVGKRNKLCVAIQRSVLTMGSSFKVFRDIISVGGYFVVV